MSTAHLSVGLLTSLSLGADGRVEGQEVAGRSYVRQPLGEMACDATGLLANVEAIAFPEAGDDWGRVVALALYDGDTLIRARTVTWIPDLHAGAVVDFAAGMVRLRDADTSPPQAPGDRRRVLA